MANSTYRTLDRLTLNGWQGWLQYFKSFSQSYTSHQVLTNRPQVLLLYRHLHKLIRVKCHRYGLREQKRSELRVLFKDAKAIQDLQDIRYCYNVGRLVQERLETGEFPPFPRRLLEPYSVYHEKDLRLYRKYIRNIAGNDVILEPGQDPPRHLFYENRQFHRDYCLTPSIVKYQTEGKQFQEEESLLS